MNIDPGIICVKHCNSDIFAFELPNQCPLCRTDLSAIQDFPFRIPFPFARSKQHPCCIVLRPTRGDFLRNYTSTADLHIGITDSQGTVHAYDEQGLSRGSRDNWEQCLAVPGLLPQQLEVMEEEWDSSLKYLIETQSQMWTADRYNETSCNCYSFVLTFLQTATFSTLCKFAEDKQTFCEQVLLPHTKTAAKYISLFRRVSSQGVFVQQK